ncbi:hypothetical protein [Egbenema bharatensis]|uniref:hypothetical protein n=1 Tax=Egbenema bharatensis TaxID=3463334 RepID=UPI003A89423E
MSQQLHLFSDRSADPTPLPLPLLEQTHQLFGTHSNSELIQRILAATKAIDEQCGKSVSR